MPGERQEGEREGAEEVVVGKRQASEQVVEKEQEFQVKGGQVTSEDKEEIAG